MATIGDVLAVIAALVGIALTSWALIVSCALLFPQKVEMARANCDQGFWRNLLPGIGMLFLGVVGVVFLQGHPFGKTLGWIMILLALGVGAVGAAGLSHLAASRLKQMAPDMGDYPAFVRGAGFLVTASMLPVLGFAFAPAVLLMSLGCGARAVFARQPVHAKVF